MNTTEEQIAALQKQVKSLTLENTQLLSEYIDSSSLQEFKNSHTGCDEYGLDADSRVWKPLKLGNLTLEHRVAMAPLTRMRAIGGIPQEISIEYYKQRATKGGLLISEATFIAKEAGGYPDAPGIYTQEQIVAWKKITDAVHEKGGYIYCQLWNIGRLNYGEMEDVKVISSGTKPYSEKAIVPEQMSIEDIQRHLKHYEHAAKCAMEAGFDGCEVHGAHGYLLEQFLNPKINCTRDDIYSGSIENRSRFMLEALQVVVDTIGAEKSAIRISPFSGYGSADEVDPYDNWLYVCEEFKKRVPSLAYISVTDPRIRDGSKGRSSDPFRAIFRGIPGPIGRSSDDEKNITFPEPTKEHPTVFLCAGGYTASDAEPCSNRTGDIIAYGRLFISNPDLVDRIRKGLELNPYDRLSFYSPDTKGYTDYPFANESTKKFVPNKRKSILDLFTDMNAYIESSRKDIFELQKSVRATEKQQKKLEKEKDKTIADKDAEILELKKRLKELELNLVTVKEPKPQADMKQEKTSSCC